MNLKEFASELRRVARRVVACPEAAREVGERIIQNAKAHAQLEQEPDGTPWIPFATQRAAPDQDSSGRTFGARMAGKPIPPGWRGQPGDKLLQNTGKLLDSYRIDKLLGTLTGPQVRVYAADDTNIHPEVPYGSGNHPSGIAEIIAKSLGGGTDGFAYSAPALMQDPTEYKERGQLAPRPDIPGMIPERVFLGIDDEKIPEYLEYFLDYMFAPKP